MPSTFAEKNEIRQAVRSMARPGVDDENIEEAYQATLRACNVTQVPSHVQSILEAPQCVQADAEVSVRVVLKAHTLSFPDSSYPFLVVAHVLEGGKGDSRDHGGRE